MSNTGVKHVSYYNNSYNIVKNVNGKNIRFGSFPTLEEAQRYVEYCKTHDWGHECVIKKNDTTPEKKYIASLPNGSYQVGKNFGSKRISFGVFQSFEEAQKHRDFCVEHDWDINICRRLVCPHNHTLPKYISKYKNRYVIQKFKDYELVVRISFTNLEDAVKERDLLMECGWDENLLMELDEARGTL